MSTAGKRKGSKFETDIVAHLRDHGIEAERLSRTGRHDQGDGYARDVGLYTVWEAKAEARMNLPEYLREIAIERVNFATARKLRDEDVEGIVIVKRRLAPIGDSYVITTLNNYFGIQDE